MRQLSGRTAVITGAGSGIGRATAQALAKAGCRLALVDLSAERLAETAATLGACPHSLHPLDVADRAAMLALPDAVQAAHGAIHILINNAGVTVAKAFHQHSLDDFDWVMGINFGGVLYGCHAFLPHLLRQEEAHIVNISSIFGVVGVPSQAAYCASKYAVRGLSEVLWEELSGTPVGLTVVHPGGIATRIAEGARTLDPQLQARLIRFFSRHAMPPEQAAAQIVRAIQKNQKRLLITKEAYFFDWLKRLLPVTGNAQAIGMLTRAMGMSRAVQDAKKAALEAAGHVRKAP